MSKQSGNECKALAAVASALCERTGCVPRGVFHVQTVLLDVVPSLQGGGQTPGGPAGPGARRPRGREGDRPTGPGSAPGRLR